jgi:predicted nucleic acid-binding Zn ribbon protein
MPTEAARARQFGTTVKLTPAKREDARYCSNRCRQAAYRRRKRDDVERYLVGDR